MSSQDVSKQLVPVCMGELDGDGFADHMAKVFTNLGYEDVKRIPAPDGGKDIVMRKGRDLYYAECKHWNSKIVGRPELQKVDSAAHRAGAKHAFLIATGTFTRFAVEYAENMRGMTVELVDRDKLIGLNEEAGYNLIFEDEETDGTVYCYPEADPEEVRSKLLDIIAARLKPEVNGEALQPWGGPLLIWYEPFYCLDLELPESDGSPFPRAQCARRMKASAWVEARFPAEGGPDEPRAIVHPNKPVGEHVGLSFEDCHVWKQEIARREGLIFFDFRLTLEEAQLVGSRYAKKVATDRNLPEDSVSVRRVYAVMVPVYMLAVVTSYRTRSVAVMYNKKPIVLPRDGLVR